MEKEQAAQQCHDLQQELAMEGEHHQEMSEEVKRLKKELNSRFSSMIIVKEAFDARVLDKVLWHRKVVYGPML